jgi:hypothetical protein
MTAKLNKQEFAARLGAWAVGQSLARVHPDATELTARATLECLAGLPNYEHVFAGDLHQHVIVLAVLSGERLAGTEVARRAQLLFERARVLGERRNGAVAALQVALYDRDVPPQERAFIVGKARRVPLFARKSQVATWVAALAEPALHAKKLRGWPAELSADAMRALLGGAPTVAS